MRGKLVAILKETTKDVEFEQGAFRDILTELMHIAYERELDWDLALNGAEEVYNEERNRNDLCLG